MDCVSHQTAIQEPKHQGLTGREVRNVAQEVEHKDNAERDGGVLPQGGNGVLNLIDEVEGVGVARVREDDADQRVGQVVAVLSGAVKGIAEVSVGVGNAVDIAAEDDETGDTDEDEGDDLEGTNNVGRPERILVVGDDTWESDHISHSPETTKRTLRRYQNVQMTAKV